MNGHIEALHETCLRAQEEAALAEQRADGALQAILEHAHQVEKARLRAAAGVAHEPFGRLLERHGALLDAHRAALIARRDARLAKEAAWRALDEAQEEAMEAAKEGRPERDCDTCKHDRGHRCAARKSGEGVEPFGRSLPLPSKTRLMPAATRGISKHLLWRPASSSPNGTWPSSDR
jgi:hypothetical protein